MNRFLFSESTFTCSPPFTTLVYPHHTEFVLTTFWKMLLNGLKLYANGADIEAKFSHELHGLEGCSRFVEPVQKFLAAILLQLDGVTTYLKRDGHSTNGIAELRSYYNMVRLASIALQLLVVEDFIGLKQVIHGFLLVDGEMSVGLCLLLFGHPTLLSMFLRYLTLRQRYQRIQGMQHSPILDSLIQEQAQEAQQL